MARVRAAHCAVFGGSFDPPHICHEEAVRLCLKELCLDRLFVVPTFLSPFKSSFTAPPELRFEWLCRVFAKYDRVSVLDVEIKKQRSVYMIETLGEISRLAFQQGCDKIYLIIGSDNLAGFKAWYMYEELIKLAEPVVVSRGGVMTDEFRTLFLDCAFSSTSFREELNPLMIESEIRDDVMSFYKGKN